MSTLFLQTARYENNEVHRNVLNERLNLKGLILFAAIYQIGDPAYSLTPSQPTILRNYNVIIT